MESFEELEHNLSGRLKSVMILVLAVFLAILSGTKNTGVRELDTIGNFGITVVTENPIDKYFNSLISVDVEMSDQRAFAHIYLDCWEQELIHAYEMLEAHTEAVTKSYSFRAASDFASYAETEGWLEAYYRNAAGAETEDRILIQKEVSVEQVICQDTLTVDRIYAQADLTRWQTLRMYELMRSKGNEQTGMETFFLFNSQTAQEALKQSGCLQ